MTIIKTNDTQFHIRKHSLVVRNTEKTGLNCIRYPWPTLICVTSIWEIRDGLVKCSEVAGQLTGVTLSVAGWQLTASSWQLRYTPLPSPHYTSPLALTPSAGRLGLGNICQEQAAAIRTIAPRRSMPFYLETVSFVWIYQTLVRRYNLVQSVHRVITNTCNKYQPKNSK